MKQKTKSQGFTLIELLVAIAIIAILMGLVVGLSGVARRKSADAKAQADLQTIAGALEEYRLISGIYPQGLAALTNDASKLPKSVKDAIPSLDPWGNEFVYADVTKYSYTIKSHGPNMDSPDDDITPGAP